MKFFNRKSKKGNIEDTMIAPFLIIILVLVIGFVIFFFTEFNDKLQLDSDIGTIGKEVSQDVLNKNIEGMGLLVPVGLLVMILWTIAGAFFIADFENWFFLLGIIILIFYTIVMGIIKTFFDFMLTNYIFEYSVAFMPFIEHYFQWFFIYQTVWFILVWVLFSLGANKQ
jgi:hypothetical protein